jgi:acyl carrier protein
MKWRFKKMSKEMEFKTIVAQYCDTPAEEITNDMRFREDLGFSSLDFMSLLGELEDTFDVELEEEDALQILTVEEALELLDRLCD